MKTLNQATIWFVFIMLSSNVVWSQSGVNAFLKPSDSLNISRRNAVIIAESVFFVGGIVQMNKLFDGSYLNTNFHFVNDIYLFQHVLLKHFQHVLQFYYPNH